MDRDLEFSMREAGRRAAIGSGRSVVKHASFTRDLMRVTAVSGTRIDVDMGSDVTPMPIKGVPTTTACAGVKVGDVVIVDTYGHRPIAIGIMRP